MHRRRPQERPVQARGHTGDQRDKPGTSTMADCDIPESGLTRGAPSGATDKAVYEVLAKM